MTPLPPLPHLRLRFTLEALEPAELPRFHGSLLRGAFGHALKKLACTLPREPSCQACPLAGACVYTRIFETFFSTPSSPGSPPPWLGGSHSSPRPYVLEPLTTATHFAPGDALRFDLVLFGQAVELHPYVRLAVERMGDSPGLGSRRARFRLARCEISDLPAPQTPLPAERVTLRFETPTRVRVHRDLVGRPTARQLVRKLVHRHWELAGCHAGAELPAEREAFDPWLAHADTLHADPSRLRWRGLRRYSNRQKQSVSLGGFVGELTLTGELGPLHPLLRSAALLHVGKGTTFGLGRVVLQ